MKKLFKLFVFLFFASASLKAQKVYFIYLQTDNQQPFYARMGDKIYNSKTAGYLILSNLRDSIYSVNIGMQGSGVADQPYSITMNKKDQGFLIKNFGDKGWGLFNLISMATIMPQSKPVNSAQSVKTEKREDNAFTNLLAKAADDSTIKEKPVIEKPVEKKTDATVTNTEKKADVKETVPITQGEINKGIIVAPVVIKEESKIDVQESKNATQIKEDSIVAAKAKEDELLKQEELRKQDSIEKAKMQTITEVEYKRSVVKLKSESSTTTGIGLVFIDMLPNDKTDTIRILIPAETKTSSSIESKQEEKKLLDVPPVDSVQKETPISVNTKNNNCKVVATENDFSKLRKKMSGENDFLGLRKKLVGENNEDDMIAEAKKVFKTKCFSTLQVKNLSTLFLTDESKYKFFDAAYQYVSDVGNFPTLQSELKEEYFINRFKAMLRQ